MAIQRTPGANRNRSSGSTGSTRSGAASSTSTGAADGGGSRLQEPDFENRPPPSFTGADFRPEFRISVRPTPGQQSAPKPALMDDWKEATVSAAAKEAAIAEFQPELDAAVARVEVQVGRELGRREITQVHKPIIDQRLPAPYGRHYGQMSATPQSRARTVQESLDAYGPHMPRYKDPFTPVAQGDPAARAKETVLWEDPHVMVLVDTFCPSPKALVIPKRQATFPTDLSDQEMERLADIAAKVSDAFGQASGSAAAESWINPPQRLTIRQLHVHVLPKLPHWEDTPRPRGVPPDPALVAEQQQFYSKVQQELAQLL